ncbi:MAG: GDP-mannose 4,6-dehydratase, partial [Muribaculaceae bacterium]|nr:GDP-mannose 4,6-dehydratase [Muribaculaceae bacterium]
RGDNVRDWLYVEDHARAIDLIFHKAQPGSTYNIGGNNEWTNIDLVRTLVRIVDAQLGNPPGYSDHLITYVTDRLGHDKRYAIDSTKLRDELGWAPTKTFEEALTQTVISYLK